MKTVTHVVVKSICVRPVMMGSFCKAINANNAVSIAQLVKLIKKIAFHAHLIAS